MSEIGIGCELFLALLELIIQDLLLVAQTLHFLESLVLHPEKLFLALTNLFL